MANIRRARRSGLVLRGGKSVRESLWIGIVRFRTNITAPSTAVIINSLNAAALALRPFTVVRTRGFIFCGSDQIANIEPYDCTVSYAVVSDQALAIGVTAVPTPETDQSSDLFFVYETIIGEMKLISAAGFADPAGQGREFDSRAMRKVQESEDIAFVIETSAVSNGVFMSHTSRMLVKLH